jgi:CheY-like chemotaxis protein
MAHILIIDDEPSLRTLFRQFLEGQGFSVAEAADGREGIRLLCAQKPDLVVTDIMMPEMDGLEVILEIRKAHPGIPVIAISGGMKSGKMSFLTHAKKFGACRIFEKPVELAEILQAVRELLADSPPCQNA